MGVYSPRPVRRMGCDLLLPLGRRSGRAVGLRKMNRNVGEDKRIEVALNAAREFIVCHLSLPVELQCPSEVQISCFTCETLLQ